MEEFKYPDEKRSGSSILKWLFFGCGGCLILVALLIVFLIVSGAWVFKRAVITDSANVLAVAHDIMDFTLPGDSRGAFAMDVGFSMAIVHDGHDIEESRSLLVLASFPMSWSGSQEESIKRKLDTVIHEEETYTVENQETRMDTLCGQKVELQVQNGTVERNGTRAPMTLYQTIF